MRPPDRIVGFVCRLLIIYGLFILPWPGWNDLYGAYFRSMARAAFERDGQKRIVLLEPRDTRHGSSDLTTRMTMGNRDLVDANGDGQTSNIDLDTRSVGWVPTALTAALILATPIPWKRKLWALLAGLFLVHVYILFSLQTWIWQSSPGLSLMALSPFWKRMVDGLEYLTITQIGASFSVPVLIWILVSFQRKDALIFMGKK